MLVIFFLNVFLMACRLVSPNLARVRRAGRRILATRHARVPRVARRALESLHVSRAHGHVAVAQQATKAHSQHSRRHVCGSPLNLSLTYDLLH